MPVDTSIYQNLKLPEVQPLQTPMQNAQQALSLSQLGMQNQQMQLQLQTQQAMRQAYAKNTDPASGQLNRQGFLSDMARVNPMAAQESQQHFAAFDKAQAEAQSAKAAAAHAELSVTVPAMGHLLQMPDDQAAAAYHGIVQQLTDQGVPMHGAPSEWNRGQIQQMYAIGSQMKEQLDNQATRTSTDEKAAGAENKRAETAAIPTKIAKDRAEARAALAKAAKDESETYARPKNLDALGSDPAKMVPYYVPKDHQAKAFSEIDAAENTKRMSQSIMDAFDKATQENTVLKTGPTPFGQIRTPGSVMALHQALQPTFKDLEGTVRQAAMDNTFRNVTPAPGDMSSTIATKRRALEQYLQSKASAPTARGYGIDLSKFDSTSAYQSTKASPSQAAAPKIKPGTVEDGYVFNGGDPGDAKNWKKAR